MTLKLGVTWVSYLEILFFYSRDPVALEAFMVAIHYDSVPGWVFPLSIQVFCFSPIWFHSHLFEAGALKAGIGERCAYRATLLMFIFTGAWRWCGGGRVI